MQMVKNSNEGAVVTNAALVSLSSGGNAVNGGFVDIPNASWLTSANFVRAGQDLLLKNNNGEQVSVRNFFALEHPPGLRAPSGAFVSPEMVIKLARPAAPGQYAQAGPAAQFAPFVELPAEPAAAISEPVDHVDAIPVKQQAAVTKEEASREDEPGGPEGAGPEGGFGGLGLGGPGPGLGGPGPGLGGGGIFNTGPGLGGGGIFNTGPGLGGGGIFSTGPGSGGGGIFSTGPGSGGGDIFSPGLGLGGSSIFSTGPGLGGSGIFSTGPGLGGGNQNHDPHGGGGEPINRLPLLPPSFEETLTGTVGDDTFHGAGIKTNFYFAYDKLDGNDKITDSGGANQISFDGLNDIKFRLTASATPNAGTFDIWSGFNASIGSPSLSTIIFTDVGQYLFADTNGTGMQNRYTPQSAIDLQNATAAGDIIVLPSLGLSEIGYVIVGTAGNDTITLNNLTTPDLAGALVFGKGGADAITLGVGGQTITVSGVETITGGTGNDAITLGAGGQTATVSG
ncbi:MAG: hypothetical protein A3H92_03465, partial [Rhodospirillales bacterium RIFCSPLOWO2_02_FULL_58_16]